MTKAQLLRLTDLLGEFLDENPLDIDGRDKDVLSAVRHDILDHLEGE